jgi:hypothetical protein
MAKKWIKNAIKHPGALTKKAKAEGKTVSQYCSQSNLSAKSQRQCNLAKTLKSFN